MKEMREIIREQAADGATVFFSSHILSEVEAVCDRVAILSRGELAVEDTIENLRDQNEGVCTIDVEVESVPEPLGLDSVAGVQDVAVDDDDVTVTCESPAVKIDVVRAVDQRATVTDIVSEDTSLETLFERYTGESAETSGGSSEAEPEAPEAGVVA
jgi:ABC-2 type transport system ATP-binding protein